MICISQLIVNGQGEIRTYTNKNISVSKMEIVYMVFWFHKEQVLGALFHWSEKCWGER